MPRIECDDERQAGSQCNRTCRDRQPPSDHRRQWFATREGIAQDDGGNRKYAEVMERTDQHGHSCGHSVSKRSLFVLAIDQAKPCGCSDQWRIATSIESVLNDWRIR